MLQCKILWHKRKGIKKEEDKKKPFSLWCQLKATTHNGSSKLPTAEIYENLTAQEQIIVTMN